MSINSNPTSPRCLFFCSPTPTDAHLPISSRHSFHLPLCHFDKNCKFLTTSPRCRSRSGRRRSSARTTRRTRSYRIGCRLISISVPDRYVQSECQFCQSSDLDRHHFTASGPGGQDEDVQLQREPHRARGPDRRPREPVREPQVTKLRTK